MITDINNNLTSSKLPDVDVFLNPAKYEYYNAYEKDIAVVNIFFGSPTVFGIELTSFQSCS